MRLGRVLRWGRVAFLSRRVPYLLEVLHQRFEASTFWLRRPVLAWQVRQLRAAWAKGQDVLIA